MSDANKQIVRRCIEEAIVPGDVAALDDFIDDEIVSHDPSDPASPVRGRDAYRANEEAWFAAFPVRQVRIDDQIAEGDTVATRFTFTGRYAGDLFGPDVTPRDVEFTGMSIDRIEDGRIVEEWLVWDALGLMRQLGVVPEPVA